MFSPPPPKPKKRAVVIGAGIVGITTARALYSTNLYDVVVLEKVSFPPLSPSLLLSGWFLISSPSNNNLHSPHPLLTHPLSLLLPKGPNPLSFNSAGNAGLVRRSSWAGLAGPSTLHHALFSFRQQASNLVGLGGRGGDGEGGSTPYLVFRPWALATAPGGIGWGMSFLKHCLFGVKERDEWLKKFTINAVGATETLGDRVGYTLHKGAFGLWGGGGSAPVNDGVRVEMGRRLPGDKGGEGEGGGKMRWPGHLNSFYLPDDLNGDCVDFGKAIIKSGGGEWGVKCEWEAVGVRMVGEGRGGRGRGGGEGREKVAAVVCVDGREEECDVLVLCDAGRGGVIKPPAPVWPVWGYSVEFVRPKGWGNDPVFDQVWFWRGEEGKGKE